MSSHPCLACSVAGLAVWVLLMPLTPSVPALDGMDRDLSARVAGVPTTEIHGDGTNARPRFRLNLSPPAHPPSPASIFLCDDDPDQIFQSSPPSPSDQAVIFSNLLKRNIRHAALATPLGWEDADLSSVLSMHLQMDRLDSVTVGLPLSYDAGADPIASCFLRLSIPVSQVQGDASTLPAVNRISIPHPETGGEKTLAGFTALLSQKQEPGFAPLLARWGDRIVFALPLANEIARRGVDLGKIRIDPGKSIFLGQDDLWIEIDPHGRIALPKADAKNAHAVAPLAIPATSLVGVETPPEFATNEGPVWFQDARLTTPQDEKDRQALLAATDFAIRGSATAHAPIVMARPESIYELAGAVVVALACGLVCGLIGGWPGRLLALPLAGGLVYGLVRGLQWILQEHSLLPLPLAALAIPVAAGIVKLFLKGPPKPASAAIAEAEEPAPEEPAES